MWKGLPVSLVLSLLACAPLVHAQDDTSIQRFSPEQLDNLLAPVALYPDPLLAQILPAATFPDQIDEAARFCRAGAGPDDIDAQPWDVSVRAVAHYSTVLYAMADGLDWTTSLGQAYVNQPDDVLASVQRLRQEARDVGNLVTTPEQDVEVDDGNIEIWPAQPQYCYIPQYDPGLAFFGSGGVFGGSIVSFSGGFPIGGWLNYDFDWRHRHIYYHGWPDRGWMGRSGPYIPNKRVVGNNNLTHVTVNRSVTTRPVNYDNLTRYNSVHQDVEYGRSGANSAVSTETPTGNSINNKIIQRNEDVNDQRIDLYRGRSSEPPAASRPERTGNLAFGGNRGTFGAKAASQRGQTSRAQAARPAPAARASGGGGSHGGGESHGGGGGSHGGGGRH